MSNQQQQTNDTPIKVRTWIEQSDVFVYGIVVEDLEDSYKVIPHEKEREEIWLKSICEIV